MTSTASDLSRQLARNAEAVCRHYLSAGRREGRYWIVGDALGSAGRSLYVRLKGSEHGKGAAGKWTDAATGEHGDLLDLIGLNCGHRQLTDTLDEARRFLSLPRPQQSFDASEPPAPAGSRKAARRLFAGSRPIASTLAEYYLRARSISAIRTEPWLRFHPRCWYRPSRDDRPGTPTAFPALIAAVTDADGTITGVHRTWLDPLGDDKAPVATPRRAMGDLLGHGVRFGRTGSVMVAGEGLETVLSLRMAMRTTPMIATLSSAHLAAVAFPDGLQRLYVARDSDAAGDYAVKSLHERALVAGIEMIVLEPESDDFNTDLMRNGHDALTARLADQLSAGDRDYLLAHA
ncbi:MAG: toprim domain-containing protein [Pseudomonadota bacterium]|nr:toprim domain-containing protein [Pseudomonadota bacterium]